MPWWLKIGIKAVCVAAGLGSNFSPNFSPNANLTLSGDGIWSLCLPDNLPEVHCGRHLADLGWLRPHRY